jgi:hypothetical protein
MSTGVLALFVDVEIIHRLGVAVRLFDIFTRETVRVPLIVTLPVLRWTAIHAATDDTYRFVVTNRDIPGGPPFDIEVEAPNGEYEAREPMQVTLPIVVGHPPPVVRPDYLLEFPLWPTRLRRTPPGETAVVGRILSGGGTNVDGLRVFLFEPPGPVPVSPYAYTNVNGEFLFRLPQLHAHMAGTVPVVTTTLNIEIRDQVNAPVSPVNPGSVAVDLGRSSLFEFTVP